MQESEKRASACILDMANNGPIQEYVIAQMIMSAIVSADGGMNELTDTMMCIMSNVNHLATHQDEIWPALMPGGIFEDLGYEVVKKQNEQKPDALDGSEYMISYHGRKPEGGWMIIKYAQRRYSESPLNFAAEIESEIMRIVHDEESEHDWARHDVQVWITHEQSRDDYLMTWSQAHDLVTMEELHSHGYDMNEHFQGIADEMAKAGSRFASDRGDQLKAGKAY